MAIKNLYMFITAVLLSMNFAATSTASDLEIKQPVPIASYFIPGLVNKDKTGSMVDMLNRISDLSGIEFDLQLVPAKRAQDSFKRGTIFGYFPELADHRHKPSCRSGNMMQKKIIVVTRRDSPEITEISQLEGLRVGAVAGYSYGEQIIGNSKINIQYVSNDVANTRKLAAGRIDAIVGDAHSTINAIVENKLQDQFRFDPDKPIAHLDVFFLFQDTEQGNMVCDLISVALEELRVEGALKRWFDYE